MIRDGVVLLKMALSHYVALERLARRDSREQDHVYIEWLMWSTRAFGAQIEGHLLPVFNSHATCSTQSVSVSE